MKFLFILLLLLSSCNNRTQQNESELFLNKKRIPKTDLQFISVAYMDVFGKAIPQQELNSLKEIFLSQGDQELNRNALIVKLLQNQTAELPGANLLSKNPKSFLLFCFKQFYRRLPTEKELNDLLTADRKHTMSASEWYYAFMISDEYGLL